MHWLPMLLKNGLIDRAGKANKLQAWLAYGSLLQY